jgi:putative membrane protein
MRLPAVSGKEGSVGQNDGLDERLDDPVGVFGLVLLALAVAGGVYAVRTLRARGADPDPVPGVSAPGLAEATAELRRRYAAGQISREDYLQGKVDLE